MKSPLLNFRLPITSLQTVSSSLHTHRTCCKDDLHSLGFAYQLILPVSLLPSRVTSADSQALDMGEDDSR